MKIKILQLNIWGGKFLPEIVKLIQKHDYDLVHLQEVANGKWLRTHPSDHNFEQLTDELEETHRGELVTAVGFENDPQTYFGNAIFYKKSFSRVGKKIIQLKKYQKFTQNESFHDRPIQDDPRCALSVLLEKDGQQFYAITAHMAWGPNPLDADYKMEQAQRLLDHLESINKPFILTGDFNIIPSTQIIQEFNKLGENLTTKHGLINTLNPKNSWVKHIFPPGLAVDYIFISKGLKENSFELIDKPDFSDHYGLMAEIEI